MNLFAPDLYRYFGIGFTAGALLVAGATAQEWIGSVAPEAVAAENVAEAPLLELSPEFQQLDEWNGA